MEGRWFYFAGLPESSLEAREGRKRPNGRHLEEPAQSLLEGVGRARVKGE